jgi:hydroxypyruvate reductase
MARAAVEMIPSAQLVSALAVTNYENVVAVDKVEVLGAGHPLPNVDGFHAAQKIAHIVQQATADETVLVLISGGGSALLPYPVDSISLEEKTATTDLLLASGVTINEINCVRKHLSRLKGGGLAKLAYPAKVHALILSDVLGDDLSTIASGATVADRTTYKEAIRLLNHRDLWAKTPISVRLHLERGTEGLIAETSKPNDIIFKHSSYVLCGSNAISLKAAQLAAEQLGYETQIYSERLCGIAKEEAEQLASTASTTMKPLALLAGGETTVNVTGTGKGGRNQEFALAFAFAAEKYDLKNWVLLSGGTDGRDGPTNAAGGVVDSNSLTRMRKAGIDPFQYLNNNDAYHALSSSNDLLITGATGTNVADLQILLLNL